MRGFSLFHDLAVGEACVVVIGRDLPDGIAFVGAVPPNELFDRPLDAEVSEVGGRRRAGGRYGTACLRDAWLDGNLHPVLRSLFGAEPPSPYAYEIHPRRPGDDRGPSPDGGRYASVRPLCRIGRPPGTSPAPEGDARGSSRARIRSSWDQDLPAALANLARAEEIAGGPLASRAALEILKRTSTTQVPELSKRGSLQSQGLFACVRSDDSGARWSLTARGTERLRASGALPTLTSEAITAILARFDRPTS